MLPVQLYPAEFITMIGFLGKVTSPQLDVPVRQQPVSIAVLIAYQSRLKIDRIYAWRSRNKQRIYRYNMPAHVVLALYKEMLIQPLDPNQQGVLNRLDQALVDYRVPMSDRIALKSNTLHDAIA